MINVWLAFEIVSCLLILSNRTNKFISNPHHMLTHRDWSQTIHTSGQHFISGLWLYPLCNTISVWSFTYSVSFAIAFSTAQRKNSQAQMFSFPRLPSFMSQRWHLNLADENTFLTTMIWTNGSDFFSKCKWESMDKY